MHRPPLADITGGSDPDYRPADPGPISNL